VKILANLEILGIFKKFLEIVENYHKILEIFVIL
jgi:hypothetical protein